MNRIITKKKSDLFFYLFKLMRQKESLVFIIVGDCRQQDEELDELSASVERIGGVGLTIHEELLAQVRFSGLMFSVKCHPQSKWHTLA